MRLDTVVFQNRLAYDEALQATSKGQVRESLDMSNEQNGKRDIEEQNNDGCSYV